MWLACRGRWIQSYRPTPRRKCLFSYTTGTASWSGRQEIIRFFYPSCFLTLLQQRDRILERVLFMWTISVTGFYFLIRRKGKREIREWGNFNLLKIRKWFLCHFFLYFGYLYKKRKKPSCFLIWAFVAQLLFLDFVYLQSIEVGMLDCHVGPIVSPRKRSSSREILGRLKFYFILFPFPAWRLCHSD